MSKPYWDAIYGPTVAFETVTNDEQIEFSLSTSIPRVDRLVEAGELDKILLYLNVGGNSIDLTLQEFSAIHEAFIGIVEHIVDLGDKNGS